MCTVHPASQPLPRARHLSPRVHAVNAPVRPRPARALGHPFIGPDVHPMHPLLPVSLPPQQWPFSIIRIGCSGRALWRRVRALPRRNCPVVLQWWLSEWRRRAVGAVRGAQCARGARGARSLESRRSECTRKHFLRNHKLSCHAPATAIGSICGGRTHTGTRGEGAWSSHILEQGKGSTCCLHVSLPHSPRGA